MKELVSMVSSISLQLLFLFITSILVKLNQWYAVVIGISIAIISLLLGVYSIIFSIRKSSTAIFLTIPVGVVTSLFAILIIGFTVFSYFSPEAGIPPVISL
ncbi:MULTISPECIES: hypothetical protein [Bacillus cereus group]|uniref:Uncharacterized protein n=1 Tax=Bacillus cereus VD048 TaxID=1053226 RepID=J8HEK1_BACCE|nr:hypothetical protein [Bacillus mycoides]EJR31552.1 hypothetical protein IIG_03067 [Bacillus cereus VD048]WOA66063.1 alpha/beta hydrolase [Bacillus mycoides]